MAKLKKTTQTKKIPPIFKKRRTLLAIVVVVLVIIGGYIGYSRWQVANLTAKAESWSSLKNKSGASVAYIFACKTEVSSPYGALYLVKAQTKRTSTKITTLSVFATDPYGRVMGKGTTSQWLYGVVAGTETYVSKDLHQYVSVTVRTATSAPMYGSWYDEIFINPANLATC